MSLVVRHLTNDVIGFEVSQIAATIGKHPYPKISLHLKIKIASVR